MGNRDLQQVSKGKEGEGREGRANKIPGRPCCGYTEVLGDLGGGGGGLWAKECVGGLRRDHRECGTNICSVLVACPVLGQGWRTTHVVQPLGTSRWEGS